MIEPDPIQSELLPFIFQVIPRKDLPPIYTMCVPVASQGDGLGKDALADLHATRQEVVLKVSGAGGGGKG